MMFKQCRGVSLVEALVGMTIGALLLLVVFSSISLYQNVKRTSVSGNSALANAMTGIHFMNADLQIAGLGFIVNNTFVCDTLNVYYNGSTIKDNSPFEPLKITDGGTGPDSITTTHGNSALSGAQSQLLQSMASFTDSIRINKAAGSQLGQLFMLAEPSASVPCTIFEATNVDTSSTLAVIDHSSGSSSYNPPNSAAFTVAPSYSDQAVLLNIGRLSIHTWRVNNNTLELVDDISGNVQQVADNVVQIHAEYGISNIGSTEIVQWTAATGAWAAPSVTNMKRVRAIRLAIVTRSDQRERAIDGSGVCTTTTQALSSWAGSPDIVLTADADWRCYRYRVIKTVIPIKNIIWGNVI